MELRLTSFSVDADGHRIPGLRALSGRPHWFRRADRVLKRRRCGSARYRARQRRIARLHAQVADARPNCLR